MEQALQMLNLIATLLTLASQSNDPTLIRNAISMASQEIAYIQESGLINPVVPVYEAAPESIPSEVITSTQPIQEEIVIPLPEVKPTSSDMCSYWDGSKSHVMTCDALNACQTTNTCPKSKTHS